jgi:hypothetical protein
MTEFILEVILIQKHADSFLDNWEFQNTVDVRTLVWIFVKHGAQKIWNGLAKVCWNICVFALDNFLGQLMQTLCVKWWLEGAHFIKQNSKRPNIRFETIGLGLDDFWGQVIWRSHNSFSFGSCFTQNSSNTKITKFNHTFFRKENILRFKIPVQYLSIVNVLQSQGYLSKPI